MAKRLFNAGATDQTIDVFIQSAAVTNGAGLTGLATGTANLECFWRTGATGGTNKLTLVAQTTNGAHTDGGFVEINATNLPGLYRLDLSDAMVATAPYTIVMLKGAANMVPCVAELEIRDPSATVAANLTHLAGTAYATSPLTNVVTIDGLRTGANTVRADVRLVMGTAPTTNVAGVLPVDQTHIGGTTVVTAQLTNISRVDVAVSSITSTASLTNLATIPTINTATTNIATITTAVTNGATVNGFRDGSNTIRADVRMFEGSNNVNATLRLDSILVENADGDAVTFRTTQNNGTAFVVEATGLNGDGMAVIGAGSGDGIVASAASGSAFELNSTSGKSIALASGASDLLPTNDARLSNLATIESFKTGAATAAANVTQIGNTAVSSMYLTNVTRIDVTSSSVTSGASFTNLANLNATVTSRASATSLDTAATNLANLDAAISTRLASNDASLTNLATIQAFKTGASTVSASVTISGTPTVNVVQVGGTSYASMYFTNLTRLDDTISSRMGATASVSVNVGTPTVNLIQLQGSNVGETYFTNLTRLDTAVSTRLASNDARLDALSGLSGSGAYTIETTAYVGTNTASTLQNVAIRFTEGANTFYAASSATGGAQFNLNAATYTISATKDGYSFGGTTRAISGNLTGTNKIAISMTAISISASTNSAETNAYLTCYDANNDVESGVSFKFIMQSGPGTDAQSFPRSEQTATSGTNGLVTVGLQKSSVFFAYRKRGDVWSPPTRVVTGTASTQALPEVLGRIA